MVMVANRMVLTAAGLVVKGLQTLQAGWEQDPRAARVLNRTWREDRMR
jgi:hypothetical protein